MLLWVSLISIDLFNRIRIELRSCSFGRVLTKDSLFVRLSVFAALDLVLLAQEATRFCNDSENHDYDVVDQPQLAEICFV